MEKVLIILAIIILITQHMLIKKFKKDILKLESKVRVDDKLIDEIWRDRLKRIEKEISKE